MPSQFRSFFDPPGPDSDPGIYHFWNEELIDSINIAIAIGRPLLLEGDAGVGKTTVARGVADINNWHFLKQTVQSRAEAEDFKAKFDAVGRLSDASNPNGKVGPPENYVEPGVLWHAFDPADAAGFLGETGRDVPPDLQKTMDAPGRVLLLDEIDKGDLDFANDLLEVFDDGEFKSPVTGREIRKVGDRNLLVVITSNGDRDLSPAFLRRCLRIRVVAPPKEDAAKIGLAHMIRKKVKPSDVLTESELLALAEIESLDTDPGRIKVSGFIDLLDAALNMPGARENWDNFIKQMTGFSQTRRKHDANQY